MSSNRYRRPDMDLAYGDLPAPDRWDSSRFARESQNRRAAPVIEQRPPYESARGREPYYDDRQYYEEDYRSGPRGSRDTRRFYEEDDYYDPRANAGAMVPFRQAPPPRPSAPPRPRMVRRQSSVDRVDFERTSRYYDYDDYRPPPPPPQPNREQRASRYDIRDNRGSKYDIRIYDDVEVQDPEYYGDNGFREYREREWTRSRTRNDDPSPDRRAPTRVSVASRSEFVEAAPPEAYEEEIVKEETTIVEKPYPRKGKTRMPKRLVHTKVLFDLGYPFYEEDEKTILILKALGPENIDEVFAKSKELRETEISITTTKTIEAAPASLVSPTHKSISEAPRSVREWDNLERSPSPGSSVSQRSRRSSRRSKSQATRRGSLHESRHESIHERKSRTAGSVHESFHEDIHRSEHRSVSPATTHRSRRTKSRATTRRDSTSSDDTTIIEKRTVIEERGPSRVRSRRGTSIGGADVIEREIIRNEEIDESNSLDIGPLALVPKARTETDIREEIRRLELERRDLRRDTEIVRYGRQVRRETSPIGLLREPSPRGEIIVADRGSDEVIAVRKDKRARSRSRPPTAGLLKAMMFTTT